MKKISETILFFGSGPVAAKSLELLARDFTVEAVITKPKPPHHKEAFPVIEVAERVGLKVFTINSRAELSELFKGKPVNSKIGIVIDYGIIIGPDVIDYFPLGIVNSHFSLLPRLRGPDPITFSILNGDKETGVSLMLIVPALDEGPLIGQSSLPLDGSITTPELSQKLINLSHELLLSQLPAYVSDNIKPTPQDTRIPATYSRKLEMSDSELDFSKPAVQLEREVRAFLEWPRSRTTIGSTKVIVTKAHILEDQSNQKQPGSLWRGPKGQFGVHTAKDILVIDYLIPAGKKEMPSQAFLAGYSLS